MSLPPATRLPANNFDFLRFALASLVVFSHSFPLATGTEDYEPLSVLTGRQVTFGALAVDSFFVISGFLILHSWHATPRVGAFLRKRVLRIYPAFLVAAALDAFIIAPAFSAGSWPPLDLGFVTRFVANALRLEAIAPGATFVGNPAAGPVNGSLWTISYEFWCYIGILVLGVCGLTKRRLFLTCGLLFFLVVSFVFVWRGLTPGGRLLGQIFGYPPFWARLLPFFLAGMVFYAWRERIELNAMGAAIAIGMLVVGAVTPFGMSVVLPLAAAYLIFWIAFLPAPRLSTFARRGDFSYGIYLFSFPILQIIVHYAAAPISPLLLFAVGWPVSIAVAAASWHLVERHCIGWAHSKRPMPRLELNG